MILPWTLKKRSQLYSVALGTTAGTIWLSHYLKKKKKSWWWIPQAVSIGGRAGGIAITVNGRF